MSNATALHAALRSAGTQRGMLEGRGGSLGLRGGGGVPRVIGTTTSLGRQAWGERERERERERWMRPLLRLLLLRWRWCGRRLPS